MDTCVDNIAEVCIGVLVGIDVGTEVNSGVLVGTEVNSGVLVGTEVNSGVLVGIGSNVVTIDKDVGVTV